ncbi:hypothetical protein H0H92_015943 [Tricholoma furcatifolium]|nr:hypothetical protein H0H92_015943 [Tricholoma furcatifolium]
MKLPSSTSFVAAALIASASAPALAAPTPLGSLIAINPLSHAARAQFIKQMSTWRRTKKSDVATSHSHQSFVSRDKSTVHKDVKAQDEKDEKQDAPKIFLDMIALNGDVNKGPGLVASLLCALLKIDCPPTKDKRSEDPEHTYTSEIHAADSSASSHPTT